METVEVESRADRVCACKADLAPPADGECACAGEEGGRGQWGSAKEDNQEWSLTSATGQRVSIF